MINMIKRAADKELLAGFLFGGCVGVLSLSIRGIIVLIIFMVQVSFPVMELASYYRGPISIDLASAFAQAGYEDGDDPSPEDGPSIDDIRQQNANLNVNHSATDEGHYWVVYIKDVILLLAITIISVSLIFDCSPWTVDIGLGFVAGLAYLGGELQGIFQGQNFEFEYQEIRDEDGVLQAGVEEALTAQQASYRKIREIYEIKMGLQTAAAIAWGLAFILAIIGIFQDIGSWGSSTVVCTAQEQQPQGEGGGEGTEGAGAQGGGDTPSADAPPADAPPAEPASPPAEPASPPAEPASPPAEPAGFIPQEIRELIAELQQEEQLRKSLILAKNASLVGPKYGSAEWFDHQMAQNFSMAITPPYRSMGVAKLAFDVPAKSQLLIGKIIQVALDAFFPKAQGDIQQFLGLLGPLLGILLMVTGAAKSIVHALMNTATTRTIVWIAFAALASWGAIHSQLMIDDMNSNITKIQEILDRVGARQADLSINQGAVGGPGGLGEIEALLGPNGVPLSENGKDTPLCMQPDRRTGRCESIAPQIKRGFSQLGSAAGIVAPEVGMVTSLADSLQNSTALTNNHLNVARKLAASKPKVDQLISKFKNHDKLKKHDLDGKSKQLLGALRRAVTNSLKKQGVDPMSLMGRTGIPAPVPSVDGKQDEKKKIPPVASQTGASAASAAVSEGKEVDPFAGLNFSEDDFAPIEASNALADDEEYVVNDIGDNPGASIFDMLSVRYLKTAFPIFFEDESATPQSPVGQ